MCEPCNVLQSGPRFDFLQPFFLFGTYADRLVASAVQFPMDLCSTSAIQPISFLLVVSQNSFNSIKLQISNPKFPLLLSTLSNTPTQNYTTVLLILCKVCSTRCPTNMAQGSQRKPSRVNNTKSILFANNQRNCENFPPGRYTRSIAAKR